MIGSTSLYKKLTKWSNAQGDKPAIVETETNESITYKDLSNAVDAMGNYFGPDPLSIVAALPGGIIDSVIWLAALIYGHLLIPVSPVLTEFEYEKLYKKHNPDIIITLFDTPKPLLKAKHLTLHKCREILKQNPKNKNVKQITKNRIDGSVYLSTSGSTGEPKGIILKATKIIITADNIRKIHKLTKDDRGITPLPFYHVNAPVVSLISSILAGSTVIIAPKYSTSHFWGWVEKYDPTWISIVPTMVIMLLSTKRPDFLNHSSLRFIRTASAPLPKVVLKRFEKKFNIPLIETYGITEAASTITANPLPPARHKPGSVGLPLGISMLIFNPDTLKEVLPKNIGEVWIKGPQVIDYYEEKRDPESFNGSWFRTGDLGYFDNEGYLFLTGRRKDIIIRGGENIAPREIEEVLLTFPRIQEVAVVGLADPIYGEQIAAFIVFDKKVSASETKAIKEFAAKKLSPQKIPASIFILNKLPLGKTGKIDKKALKMYTVAN